MTIKEFRHMALSFPGAIETPHFDRAAFKVVDKRIFATLHEESKTANLKLSEVDQSVFSSFDKTIVYPVPNKWGLQGWTTFELKKIPKTLMLDALDTAYKDVFKSKRKKK
jgi:hypothetical protein